MSAVHYSNQIIDIMKPKKITSTHVTVSIPGTSKFLLLKSQNWFTSKICGQVMLFYIKKVHRLHVFLQPRNVDPREVCYCVHFHLILADFINKWHFLCFFQVRKCNKDYTLIQSACECMLTYNCEYSMSCDPVEEHELSERPVSTIQPSVSMI